MEEIFFEGVRCFHDYHTSPLKPITLLVGENSSGKTTFLALTRLAWNIAGGEFHEDIFNQKPLMLGSYDQIACLRGGQAGRAKSFTIGLRLALNVKTNHQELFSSVATISAKFIPMHSEPTLEEWLFECGNFKATVKPLPKSRRADITIVTPKGLQEIKNAYATRNLFDTSSLLMNLYFLFSGEPGGSIGNRQTSVMSPEEIDYLQELAIQVTRSLGSKPYAFAPIRSEPIRTYDPIKDVPRPEGSHVPMVLAKSLPQKTEGSNRLGKALDTFGQASGLFNHLEIKRKGSKESDPFQISVKISGPAFNLVDVGYGVSQVLPIIVDIVQNPSLRAYPNNPEARKATRAQAKWRKAA